MPLVRLGAERFVICEPDHYEINNLNRQAADLGDIGRNKGEVQAAHARAINPEVEVLLEPDGVTEENVDWLVGTTDVVIDGVDVTEPSGIAAKRALHDEAWRQRRLVISGLDLGGTQLVYAFDYRDGRTRPLGGRLDGQPAGIGALEFLSRLVDPLDVPRELVSYTEAMIRGQAGSPPQLAPAADQFGVLAAWMVLDFTAGRPVRKRVKVAIPDLVMPRSRRIASETARMLALARVKILLEAADVVLLAATADGDPAPGPVEARALATPSLRCELALLHPGQPSGTARWLAGRAVADHHHLRDGQPADAVRPARMITGAGYGLVLGGGGPRGFAHLGVIHALEEAGVPVDVVGGTSIGAIVGALCALGLDDAARVRALTHQVGRLVTLTLPLVAVSSGRRVDRLLADRLGSVPIEDLPRGFFCVSASLTRAEEVIHDRGPLWPAVRASASLPGIFPPVYADGDLLVDGATLNNVPVDVMRGRVGGGCVIAVDLSLQVETLTVAPFGPGLSGWRVLGRRLNPFVPAHPVPGIGYILTRSPSLNQVRHRRAALDGVDLLLRPPVDGFGGLDFKGADPLIELGYRYTADALARSGLAQRFAT